MNVRCAPVRDWKTLQDEIARAFAGNWGRFAVHEGMTRGTWQPRVDIFENQSHIILEAELPGLKREDFELSVENNVLTLHGERKFEKQTESDNYHRVERAYGAFSRSFTLPSRVQAENATAEYKNGVLRVSLPKREEVKARRIEITGGDKPALEVKAENVGE